MRLWLIRIGIALVAVFALAQAVPYGRDHANPPVTAEPRWDSQATRSLAVGACFDCHSNLTTWPWYSNVAPVSWLNYSDVRGGREELNFSEWHAGQVDVGEVVDAIRSDSMPPWFYRPLHSAARLSATEKAQLIAGLERSLR